MRTLLLLPMLGTVAGAAVAPQQVQSGLVEGDEVPPFKVAVATGPDADKELEYLSSKTFKDKPVLLIYVHRVTRPGFRLLRVLDKYGQHRKDDGLQVMIVRLTDDVEQAVRHSKLMESNYGFKSLWTVSLDGPDGPPNHGLTDRAELTILLLDKEHKVVHNTARGDPQQRDFEPVRKGIDKLLGPPKKPFDAESGRGAQR
jgi:hypothetical protein